MKNLGRLLPLLLAAGFAALAVDVSSLLAADREDFYGSWKMVRVQLGDHLREEGEVGDVRIHLERDGSGSGQSGAFRWSVDSDSLTITNQMEGEERVTNLAWSFRGDTLTLSTVSMNRATGKPMEVVQDFVPVQEEVEVE
jgi:hypothetical protein